jgi:hypothetical protein
MSITDVIGGGGSPDLEFMLKKGTVKTITGDNSFTNLWLTAYIVPPGKIAYVYKLIAKSNLSSGSQCYLDIMSSTTGIRVNLLHLNGDDLNTSLSPFFLPENSVIYTYAPSNNAMYWLISVIEFDKG